MLSVQEWRDVVYLGVLCLDSAWDERDHPRDADGKFSRHAAFRPDAAEAQAYREQFDRLVGSRVSMTPPLNIGRTPKVLRALGVPDLDMTIRRDVIHKASNGVKENHDIPRELLRSLPEKMADPLAVFDSKTEPGSLVVLLELKTSKNGFQAMAAVRVGKADRRVLVNDVASVYGKPDRQYQVWAQEGLLRYASERFARNDKPRSGTTVGASIAPRGSPDQGSTAQKILTEADVVNAVKVRSDRR